MRCTHPPANPPRRSNQGRDDAAPLISKSRPAAASTSVLHLPDRRTSMQPRRRRDLAASRRSSRSLQPPVYPPSVLSSRDGPSNSSLHRAHPYRVASLVGCSGRHPPARPDGPARLGRSVFRHPRRRPSGSSLVRGLFGTDERDIASRLLVVVVTRRTHRHRIDSPTIREVCPASFVMMTAALRTVTPTRMISCAGKPEEPLRGHRCESSDSHRRSGPDHRHVVGRLLFDDLELIRPAEAASRNDRAPFLQHAWPNPCRAAIRGRSRSPAADPAKVWSLCSTSAGVSAARRAAALDLLSVPREEHRPRAADSRHRCRRARRDRTPTAPGPGDEDDLFFGGEVSTTLELDFVAERTEPARAMRSGYARCRPPRRRGRASV